MGSNKQDITKLSLAETIDVGLKEAIATVLWEHKQLGHSIHIEVDGKLVEVSPDEIVVPEYR